MSARDFLARINVQSGDRLAREFRPPFNIIPGSNGPFIFSWPFPDTPEGEAAWAHSCDAWVRERVVYPPEARQTPTEDHHPAHDHQTLFPDPLGGNNCFLRTPKGEPSQEIEKRGKGLREISGPAVLYNRGVGSMFRGNLCPRSYM